MIHLYNKNPAVSPTTANGVNTGVALNRTVVPGVLVIAPPGLA